MKENYVVYHHTDMDGHGAGWQVHLNEPDIPLHNFHAKGYESPFRSHKDGDTVYITDLSFTKETIKALFEICDKAERVIWIDHHKDKINQYDNLTYFIHEGISACALTYLYFIHGKNYGFDLFGKNKIIADQNEFKYISLIENFDKSSGKETRAVKYELPKYIAHISDYDCWNKVDKDSDPFIIACESYCYSVQSRATDDPEALVFNENFWGSLAFDKVVDKFIKDGKTINRYLTSRYARELADSGFVSTYNGKDIYCMNGNGNSFVFGDKQEKYPMTVLFNYNGQIGKYEYSFYSSANVKDRIMCNEVAEKWGGGGHPGASGCSVDHILFYPKVHDPYVFLGGTCNEDPWRDELMPKLDEIRIKYFNPVVDDWNEEAQAKEDEAKNECNVHLYVITPNQTGYYSFAEMMQSVLKGKKTILAIIAENDFSESKLRSIDKIGKDIVNNGGYYTNSLNGIISILKDMKG